MGKKKNRTISGGVSGDVRGGVVGSPGGKGSAPHAAGGREGDVGGLSAPALPPREPEVRGALSPLAVAFLREYRKTYDEAASFAKVGIEDEAERERFLGSAKLRQQMQRVHKSLEAGAGWNRDETVRRSLELYDKLMERMEEGDSKVAAPLVNLLRTELEAHGELRKEDAGSRVVVNVNMDVSGGSAPDPAMPDPAIEAKVVGGDE